MAITNRVVVRAPGSRLAPRWGFVAAFAAWLLLAGCGAVTSGCEDQAKTRQSSWQKLVIAEIPLGSSKANILAWGRSQGISFEAQDTALFARLERIDCGSVGTCAAWHVTLTIVLDGAGQSIQQSVNRYADCA